jgi:uncharacterized protein (TIGR00251 family)
VTHGARSGASDDGSPDAALEVIETEDRVRFAVHVQPRAGKNGIAGVHGGAIKVRITAPPVEGAANQALIDLLARQLGVPRSSVRLLSGRSARHKVIEVHGITAKTLRATLFQGR